MSKIAEMLRALDDRDMRFDLVLEECAKEDERRDAEIERLREERKDQDAEVISQFAKIAHLNTEIERLRRLWNATDAELRERDKLAFSQCAEIERLRERCNQHELFRHQHRDCDQMGIDLQRMRRLLTEWVSAVDAADYPETLYELVAYGSEHDLGDQKSLVARTNEALGND